MKSLKAPVIFACFAGLLALASCKPTEYRVERSAVINAPVETVFEQVNTMANRANWSPWEQLDPDMEKSYDGPASGVGSVYTWSSENDSVGSGRLEIIESHPGEYIKSKLSFTEPMESESTIEWNFMDAPEGTKTTWAVSGELPGFLFWMGQDDMEKALSPSFETGLANLKRVSEEHSMGTMDHGGLTAEITTVESKPYYYIQNEVAMDDLDGDFFGTRFGKIMQYLGEDGQNLLGAPFAIYHKWDEATRTADVAVAIACKSDKPADGEIQKGDSYAGEAVMCRFTGPYEQSGEAHMFLNSYIDKNGYKMVGSPWEVYVTDPGMEPDSTKWVTDIYYPIASANEPM